jgi:hypothetical protein
MGGWKESIRMVGCIIGRGDASLLHYARIPQTGNLPYFSLTRVQHCSNKKIRPGKRLSFLSLWHFWTSHQSPQIQNVLYCFAVAVAVDVDDPKHVAGGQLPIVA